jgi:phenylalanyl-tRNA synthetase beta chain
MFLTPPAIRLLHSPIALFLRLEFFNMTISYNWLKQYINFSETPEEIAAILTSTGLEVESIEPFETIKGGLKGVVIGEVLTCAKHPNADKLSLTTVDVGAERPYAIVCGAPNVAAGQKVVVALPGTTLYPFKGEPTTLKTTKIRGEVSEGMICAEDELGMSDNHAGIMVLDTKLKNGTPAADYFRVEADYVFEIGLTPNRADAASHVGVARDLKAALKKELVLPSVDDFKVDNISLSIPVIVETPEACPRYSAVTISNVVVKESPDWLKNRLKSIGLNPINNIVDITNFVCHELGQPLHAFDAEKITGKKVIVKTLPQGSKFITLDGKERELNAKDLMICNAEEGMCIAGVFGGIKSGITSTTKNIFLESACFSPQFLRKTSSHHQLVTDASFRFVRGTDPNMTVYALKRAAILIKELAGGNISSEVVDVYPVKVENKSIVVKQKNIDRLIGKSIPQKEIFEILKSLEIEVTLPETGSHSQRSETVLHSPPSGVPSVSHGVGGFTVSVPPYRVDVLQEADVVEEILRIYGFNKIELSETVGADYLAEFPSKDMGKFRKSLSEMLAGSGFQEILTNSLTTEAYQAKTKLNFAGKTVEMLNKLSEEQGILRQTMLFTGLEVCAHNINRKQKELKLFEFGKTYSSIENVGAEKAVDQAFQEKEFLALYFTGQYESENWINKTRSSNYHDLAQHVGHVLEKCNAKKVKQSKTASPIFEYGMDLMRGSNVIGRMGKVKSAIARELGVKQEVFYAEIEAAILFQSAFPDVKMKETPKFPEVRRDLSLVLDAQIKFEEIQAVINATERKLITDVTVFDVYKGENIPEGKKAYALGFTLLNEEKTLTDEEIDKVMNKLINSFEEKLGAIIRK